MTNKECVNIVFGNLKKYDPPIFGKIDNPQYCEGIVYRECYWNFNFSGIILVGEDCYGKEDV
jgi:hypothetical protein